MSDVAASRIKAVALLLALLLPTATYAQNTPDTVPIDGAQETAESTPTVVKANPSQVRLNEAGIGAMIDGDLDMAIERFLSSLQEGELNVTYLNLGRAYAKQERCAEAAEAYAKVDQAPVVVEPSLADVQAALKRYRQELDEECLGSFVPTCEEPDITVRVDDNEPVPCAGVSVSLMPGPHKVEAIKNNLSREWSFEIRPRSEVHLMLAFEGHVEPQHGPSGPSMQTWAFITAGTGLALVATALIVEVAVLGPDIDDYEAAASAGDRNSYETLRDSIEGTQALNTGLYIGGVVLVGAGAALYFLFPEEAPVGNVWLAPGGGGATMRWSF